MLTDFPLYKPSDFQMCMQLVGNLAQGNEGRFANDALIGSNGNPPFSTFGGGTGQTPAYYAMRTGGYYYIVVGPTPNVGSATAFMAGYLPGALTGNISPNNSTVDTLASNIVSALGTNWWQPTQRYTLVGFSLGGAIVENLAARISSSGNQTVNVVTFGAPRPGGSSLARACSRCYCFRYMTPQDPIPLFPPSLADFAFGTGGFSSAVMRQFNQFVHPSGGLVLDTDGGQPVPGEVPPNAGLINTLSLASFLYSQVAEVASPHSITTYIRYLNTWVAASATIPRRDFHVAPQEQPNAFDRNANDKAIRAAQAAVFAQGEVQQQGQTIIPPTLQFSVQRSGKIWSVYFQGSLVAVGPTKRRARRLKNLGNDLLASLSRQGVVDEAALGVLFQQYLTAASDPAGGVQPTIQTQWPTQPVR